MQDNSKKVLQHTKSSPAIGNILKSAMTRSAPSSPSSENKASQRLHDDMQKLQADQIQLIR